MSETRFNQAKSQLSFSQSIVDRLGALKDNVTNMLPANTVSYAGPPQETAPAAPTEPVQRFPSDVVDLPTGQARTLPERWKPLVQTAYQKYPQVPKGLLESILQQESSMGTNDASYDPSIGESAWLGGLTKSAKDELMRRTGKEPDFQTQNGAIDSMAQYLSLIKDRHNDKGEVVNTVNDPVELYNQFYKTDAGHKLTDKQLAHFKDMINHYSKD